MRPDTKRLIPGIRYQLTTALLVIIALIALAIVLLTPASNTSLFRALAYGAVFVFLPLVAAWGLWSEKTWGILLSMLFYLSQCVKPLAILSWFPFMPPVSLAIPYGNFTQGEGMLIDVYAITITAWLVFLFHSSRNSARTTQEQKVRA